MGVITNTEYFCQLDVSALIFNKLCYLLSFDWTLSKEVNRDCQNMSLFHEPSQLSRSFFENLEALIVLHKWLFRGNRLELN